jgi:hypothetical protein
MKGYSTEPAQDSVPDASDARLQCRATIRGNATAQSQHYADVRLHCIVTTSCKGTHFCVSLRCKAAMRSKPLIKVTLRASTCGRLHCRAGNRCNWQGGVTIRCKATLHRQNQCKAILPHQHHCRVIMNVTEQCGVSTRCESSCLSHF